MKNRSLRTSSSSSREGTVSSWDATYSRTETTPAPSPRTAALGH
ncbi:hypothetical protein WKI71_14275 [Streptomyces sp. MS1.AVA.1]|uniref:Uncharacterized protein n=1 Tax=Streptomyces machairae TaxID=3134109 RepID=A0ABU8UKQ7_9ACTN